MRTLDRYIAGLFIKNYFIGIACLCVLFLFQALLGDIMDKQFTSDQIIVFHLLNLPAIFVQMSAPSILVATVMTLSGLSRTNELIACYSIGLGLRRISTLILSVVVIISCMILVLDDRILPLFFRKREVYYYRDMQKRNDFYFDIKQDKIWYRSKNTIYNLQRFDRQSKAIFGMSVYVFDPKFNLTQIVDATRAEFTEKGWKFIQGSTTTFTEKDQFPVTDKFDTKEMQIDETPRDFQEIEKKVEGLRLKELRNYIKKVREAGADTKGYEVKFHSRISLSFIPIVMCFLGIPFSTRGRREGGVAKDLGLCMAVTFFYWLFYSIGLSLGTNGALPPWLAAWAPSGIFAALAAYLLTRKPA